MLDHERAGGPLQLRVLELDLGGARMDGAAQEPDPQQGGGQRRERAEDHEREDAQVGPELYRLVEPLVPQRFALRRRDARHALLDEIEGRLVALGHGPAELPQIQRKGFGELLLVAVEIEIVVRRTVVHAKDLDVAGPDGIQDRDVARVGDLVRDAVPGQLFGAGIAAFDADQEAVHRLDVVDAGNRRIDIDADRLRFVRPGEIEQGFAPRRAENHVDHVGPAVVHVLQRVTPLHGLEVDVDACLLFPQVPEVDDITFGAPVLVEEQKRGIVIVGNDVQRPGIGVRRGHEQRGNQHEQAAHDTSRHDGRHQAH